LRGPEIFGSWISDCFFSAFADKPAPEGQGKSLRSDREVGFLIPDGLRHGDGVWLCERERGEGGGRWKEERLEKEGEGKNLIRAF
jgi:hypothetical protein